MYTAIHTQLLVDSTYEQKHKEGDEGQVSLYRRILDGAKQPMEEKNNQ